MLGGDDVIVDGGGGGDPVVGDTEHQLVPWAFFQRNEEPFRSLVNPERAAEQYADVARAKRRLCDAVRASVAVGAEQCLVHDTINNALYLKRAAEKKRPAGKAAAAEQAGSAGAATDGGADTPPLEEARDRNRRLLHQPHTTLAVREALEEYTAACAAATDAVRRELQALSEALQPLLPTLVTAAHWSLYMTTLSNHVALASLN